MEERRTQARTRVDWLVKFAPPGEELHARFLRDLNAKGLSILRGAHRRKMRLQFLEGPVTDQEKLLRMLRGKF